MKFSRLRWPEIEKYLKEHQDIVIPIGSVEQHGPTGLVGTDFLTATTISQRVGEQEKILVAPPMAYGMSAHHMGFTGTITLSPRTLMSVVVDVITSLAQHGFSDFYFVNGHGGNIAPITTAFCEIKERNNSYKLHLLSWFQLEAVKKYEEEVFQEQNGHHATPGEISVTMATYPEAFAHAKNLNVEVGECRDHRTHWPLSAQEYREIYPDGRIASNPNLATEEHGKKLIQIAAQAIGEFIRGHSTSRF